MAAGLARKTGGIASSKAALKEPAACLKTLEGMLADGAGDKTGGKPSDAPLRVPLGIAAIDRALDPYPGEDCPKGIIANGLHEVRAETGLAAGAGAGFSLALGLTMARGKLNAANDQAQAPPALPPIFWIADRYTAAEYGRFYGPGLCAFGLRPEDLIRIHPESREESLWAAGEVAATPGAAAFCLIEIRKHPREMDLTTSRRLLLRAQASGTPVILLRQSGRQEASAALTRWCVHPAPPVKLPAGCTPQPLSDQFIGPPTFDVSLEKCRGGNANSQTRWTLEWNPDDQRLAPATGSRSTRSHFLSPAAPTTSGGKASIHLLRSGGYPDTPLPVHPSAETGDRPHPAQKRGA